MITTHIIDGEGAFHVRNLSRGQRPGDVIRPGERFASAGEVMLEMDLRRRRSAHGADADWKASPAGEYALAALLVSPLSSDDLDALNRAATGDGTRRRRTRPIHVPGLTPNRAEVDVDTEITLMLEHANQAEPIAGAAYIAWRLTWLHPYADGSGRTSRAAAYALLCQSQSLRAAHGRRERSLGVQHLTVPERIERSRREYLASVNAAHVAADRGDHYERFVDLSRFEKLLARLVNDQIEGRPSPEDKPCGCP